MERSKIERHLTFLFTISWVRTASFSPKTTRNDDSLTHARLCHPGLGFRDRRYFQRAKWRPLTLEHNLNVNPTRPEMYPNRGMKHDSNSSIGLDIKALPDSPLVCAYDTFHKV